MNKTLKDLVTILKFFLKTEEEGMLLKPFFKVNITLISEPGKDNSHTHTHTHTRARALQVNISDELRNKYPQQNINKLNTYTQYTSKIGKPNSGYRNGKVSCHPNLKERQCYRIFKLP